MASKKFILGGGINGLIFAFYNPEYLIISPELGGQNTQSFECGPRYLHANTYTKELLKDLNMPIVEAEAYVGYCVDNFVCKSPPENFDEKYYRKSRCTKSTSGMNKSTMNSGKNKFKYYVVDWEDFMQELILQTQRQWWHKDKVLLIDTDAKIIETENKHIHYDELVNTLPLPLFLRMMRKSDEAKLLISKNVTYVKLDQRIISWDYDFVYYAGKQPYHRISKHNGYVVAELIGNYDTHTLQNLFLDFYLDHTTIVNSQIIDSPTKQSIPLNIWMLGRYAQWYRSVKIEDVTEVSQRWQKLLH